MTSVTMKRTIMTVKRILYTKAGRRPNLLCHISYEKKITWRNKSSTRI